MSETFAEEAQLNDLPLWADEEASQVLKNIAEANNVPVDVLAELVGLQRARQHQERAAGIYQRIEEILGRMD
ncbi:DNA modification system-associated small protein [Neorhizobium sp. IRAMC:178]|uniref:DNA modification system-associated small protein n=1 Tax=Neorhizobium tunisiense TaxID=3144793 RepID=UPI0031F65184